MNQAYFELELGLHTQAVSVETSDKDLFIEKILERISERGLAFPVLSILWTDNGMSGRAVYVHKDGSLTGALTEAKVEI